MKTVLSALALLATFSFNSCTQDQKAASTTSEEWYIFLDKNAQAAPMCIVHKGKVIVGGGIRYKQVCGGPFATKKEAENAEKKCKECKDPEQ